MTTSATANGRDRATTSSFLRRVRIRNYKSIAYCDVELGPLTILVGRNGAGKSNFLDALRFVGDALRNSFSQAIKSSGGPYAIERKGIEATGLVAIELGLDLGNGNQASYAIEMGFSPGNWFAIWNERLEIKRADDVVVHAYEVSGGQLVHSTVHPMPPVAHDRLYLVNASGLPEFRSVYDALFMMEFYSFSPERMRAIQAPDSSDVLNRDGANIASMIGRIDSEPPPLDKERLLGYLSSIVPGILDVKRVTSFGPMETLAFEQAISGSGSSREFYATSMSDGTLRALGTLVALAQLAMDPPPIRLVGIEEPETSLHPWGAAVMLDALQEAAVAGQVLVTTQSPDLIDRVDLDSDRILIVQMRDGQTVIGPIDSTSREIIDEHLCAPGELLRQEMFEPERAEPVRRHPATISESSMAPVPE